jgi:hypothetical protein
MWKVFVAKLWICVQNFNENQTQLWAPQHYMCTLVVIAGSAKVLCASFYPCPDCVSNAPRHILLLGYIHFGSCYAHFELVIIRRWAHIDNEICLWMKEGNLFCFVVMISTELGCFRLCSWCLWKALDMLQIVFLASLESSWRGGVHGLGSLAFGLAAVQKFLNILNDFFTEN